MHSTPAVLVSKLHYTCRTLSSWNRLPNERMHLLPLWSPAGSLHYLEYQGLDKQQGSSNPSPDRLGRSYSSALV